jgi:hypothetical protein
LLTAKVDVNGVADIKLYKAFEDIGTVATMSAFEVPKQKYKGHSYFSLLQNVLLIPVQG